MAPDQATAEIVRRHEAGQKLTPVEYGKLGAWKARLKGVFARKPMAAATPGAVTAAAQPGEAQSDSAGPAPVDPDLVRRTTEAILKTCDSIARTWIVSEAKKAGADEATSRTFDMAAALQPGPKDLMVQTSPEVLIALGVNSGNYPIAAFLTGLTVWSGSLLVAVKKLRTMAEERNVKELLEHRRIVKEDQQQPQQTMPGPGPVMPVPPRPPGAPPLVTAAQ